METRCRQPPDWRGFGFIDVEAVEQYEGNWDLLKTQQRGTLRADWPMGAERR